MKTKNNPVFWLCTKQRNMLHGDKHKVFTEGLEYKQVNSHPLELIDDDGDHHQVDEWLDGFKKQKP